MTTAGNKNEINALISQESMNRAERFLMSFEKTAEQVKQLEKALQAVESRLKGIKLQQITRNATSGNSYMAGAAASSDVNVRRTSTGADAKYIALYNQALKLDSERAALALSRSRTLDSDADKVGKINNLEQAQLKLKAAQYRLADALTTEDHHRALRARDLVTAFQGQVNKLQAVNRMQADIAKGEEIRAKAAVKATAEAESAAVRAHQATLKRMQAEIAEGQKARAANQRAVLQPVTDRKNASRARELSELKVLGDGGASLLKIQTGLLANYTILNTVRTGFMSAVQGAVELDNSLRNLQAVVRVTDGNLVGLKDSILGAAETSKFSAVEVADAAVLLGQAGFSNDQINDSITAITNLATATGTDLARSVDIATSIMGIFNLEAGRMTEIANTLTQAMNSSKLDMEKMTLGIQYAGNTAYDAGVSFEELTAGLGAMANAGIRSGSTLGTGMRQILVALEKPSDTFKQKLDAMGLSVYDVDLKSKGLYQVLKTLKDAGFSASDAIDSFEVRSASAFIAVSNNLDVMQQMQDSFYGSSAAAVANDTQMRSLQNQYENFGAAAQTVVSEALQPMLFAVRDMFKGLTEMLTGLRKNGDTLRTWGTAIMSVVAGIVAMKGIALLSGLFMSFVASVRSAILVLEAYQFAQAAVAAGAATTAEAVGFLGGAMAIAMPIITGLAAVAAGLYVAFSTASAASRSFEDEQQGLNSSIGQVQTSIDKTQGSLDKYTAQMTEVDDKIESLQNRYKELSSDNNLLQTEISHVRRQFAGMGYDLGSADSAVDGLITKLQALRVQLAQGYTLAINVQIGNLAALKALKIAENASLLRDLGNTDLSGLTEDQRKAVLASQNPNLKPEERAQINTTLASQLAGAATTSVVSNPTVTTTAPMLDANGMPTGSTYDITAPNPQRSTSASQQATLEAAMRSSNQILANQDLMGQLADQTEAAQVSDKTQKQKSAPEYQPLFNAANKAPLDVKADLAKIAKDTRGQPTDAFNSLKELTTNRTAIYDQRIAEIQNSGLTQENKDELTGVYSEAKAMMVGELKNAWGEASKRSENALGNEASTLTREFGNLKDRIGAADTPAQVDEAAKLATEKAGRLKFKSRQQIMATVEDPNAPLDANTQNLLDNVDNQYNISKEEIANAVSDRKEALAKKANSGGGTADSGAARDFNLQMDNFKTGLEDAKQNLKYGDMAAPEAVSQMDAIIAKAKEELEIRRQQMEVQKVGSAEYNRLKGEEKTLLSFIREEESNIRDIKEEQGLLQFDLNKSIQDWATQNLNIQKTLEEGIGSVLSNMTSSFATMFTEIANGTMSAKEAFREFAGSVVKSIEQVIAQMIAMWVMQKILGMFGYQMTGGSGPTISPIASTGRNMIGGAIPKATGGAVEGNVARDSKLYKLMPGEYVLRKSAAQMVGYDQLDQINAMGNRAMATGGHVGVATQKKGPLGQTNVYVVAPEQQPVPGPSDIIAIINDDISRGGSTKRLIKSVSMGY